MKQIFISNILHWFNNQLSKLAYIFYAIICMNFSDFCKNHTNKKQHLHSDATVTIPCFSIDNGIAKENNRNQVTQQVEELESVSKTYKSPEQPQKKYFDKNDRKETENITNTNKDPEDKEKDKSSEHKDKDTYDNDNLQLEPTTKKNHPENDFLRNKNLQQTIPKNKSTQGIELTTETTHDDPWSGNLVIHFKAKKDLYTCMDNFIIKKITVERKSKGEKTTEGSLSSTIYSIELGLEKYIGRKFYVFKDTTKETLSLDPSPRVRPGTYSIIIDLDITYSLYGLYKSPFTRETVLRYTGTIEEKETLETILEVKNKEYLNEIMIKSGYTHFAWWLQTLGLPTGKVPTQHEVKAAYKKLSTQNHPDKVMQNFSNCTQEELKKRTRELQKKCLV